MEDLDFALHHMSRNHDVEEWILMRDVLRLSEEAVHSDADMIPSQGFGRVSKVIVKPFAKSSSYHCRYPSQCRTIIYCYIQKY